jgi:DUF971 family protein
MRKFLRTIFLTDLLQGLWVTFRNQHPKNIYTEQYLQQWSYSGPRLWRSVFLAKKGRDKT